MIYNISNHTPIPKKVLPTCAKPPTPPLFFCVCMCVCMYVIFVSRKFLSTLPTPHPNPLILILSPFSCNPIPSIPPSIPSSLPPNPPQPPLNSVQSMCMCVCVCEQNRGGQVGLSVPRNSKRGGAGWGVGGGGWKVEIGRAHV